MLEPFSIELEPLALRAGYVTERTILHIEKRLSKVEVIHIKPVLNLGICIVLVNKESNVLVRSVVRPV